METYAFGFISPLLDLASVTRQLIGHSRTTSEVTEEIERTTAKCVIEVIAKEPAFLVLTESYYPGWRVFVGGKEAQILRTNYLFQGVDTGLQTLAQKTIPEEVSTCR